MTAEVSPEVQELVRRMQMQSGTPDSERKPAEDVVLAIHKRGLENPVDISVANDWVNRHINTNIAPDWDTCPNSLAFVLWWTLKDDEEQRNKWVLEQSAKQTAVDVKRAQEDPAAELERRMRDDGSDIREAVEAIEREARYLNFTCACGLVTEIDLYAV